MMIDRTAEDLAQDKRLDADDVRLEAINRRFAALSNKIDELTLQITQLQSHCAPLMRISDTLDHIGHVISKKLKGK